MRWWQLLALQSYVDILLRLLLSISITNLQSLLTITNLLFSFSFPPTDPLYSIFVHESSATRTLQLLTLFDSLTLWLSFFLFYLFIYLFFFFLKKKLLLPHQSLLIYLIPPLTRNSPSGSAVEGGFFLKFQGFIMCHTYPLQLSPGKGQKYTAATLFLRPELSLPLLWPLPSLHFLRQPKHLLSFTQTARTIRLEFSHAQNLGLSSFWDISCDTSTVVPQLTFLIWVTHGRMAHLTLYAPLSDPLVDVANFMLEIGESTCMWMQGARPKCSFQRLLKFCV